MDFGFAGVAAITVICYLIAQAVKATKLDNKWLPVICGISGAGLGIACFLTMPGFPANDWVTAVAEGITSGFAATGINQVYKQLTKRKNEEDNDA